MEHSKKDCSTGRTRPVFGSATMIGARAGLDLPVSLVATAMAGEMRSGSPAASNTNREAAESCESRTAFGETAELIGQGELPLQAALAARDEKHGRDAAESGPPLIGSFEIPTSDIISLVAAEQGSTASHERHPQRCRQAIAAAASDEPALSAIVQTRPVPRRGGRPAGVERYPFGALTPVSINEAGEMIGPCFLIPESDDPARHIAAARKRHAGKTFITRSELGGTMVWRRK